MRSAQVISWFAVIGCALCFSIPDFAQNQKATFHGKAVVDREVLVKFKQDTPAGGWASVTAACDLRRAKRVGGVRALYHLQSRSKNVDTMITELSARKDVLYAEPNYIVEAFATPNDPGFPQLWSLQNTGQSYGYPAGTPGADISAVAAWDIFTGNTNYVIGVVDTGLDYTHPDLQPNVWTAPEDFTLNIGGTSITCPKGSHGFNAIAWNCDPRDDNRHGTHVSGTIGAAGNNGLGVVGVNWTTQIIGLKFLSAGGYGYLTDAINAIEFAVQLKQQPNSPAVVRVLSNSWGGGGFSQALMDEIQSAANQDILFVAAAGNNSASNDTLPAYPASYSLNNIVSVAATDNNDALATFSNYGANTVHLGAPGVDILSTLPGGSFGLLSGTSMATPHVSGAAMLVLSACALGTDDLKQTILQNVDAIPSLSGITTTGGRLNVNKALRSCSGPVSLIPHVLSFGRVQVGSTAGPKHFTLQNNQDVVLNISGISSPDPQFSLEHNCGAQLAPRANCQITVSFLPASLGDFNVTLQIADDGPNSPHSATMTGSGSEDPDLAMTSLVGPRKPVAPGGPFSVTATVSNVGIFAAPSSTTGFYLTTYGIRDSNSLLLAQSPVPNIDPAANFVQTASLTMPANATAGTYEIVACANDTNSFSETNTSNNCAAAPLTVSLADLIESAVSAAPATTGPGRTLQLTDTVTNQGGGDAAATVTQYYLSSGTSKSTNAVLLTGVRAIAPLTAGSSSTGTTAVTVPANVAVGSYYVLACADDTNLVAESNEANNCAAASARIQVGPDLIEAAVSLSRSTSGAGSSLQLSDTVTNQGGGDAAATVTQFYLSSGTSRNSNAVLLTGSRAITSLAAGTSATDSTTVTIPANVAVGSYYVLACADDTNLVAETNEANNCLAASTRLQIGPDLTEASVSVNRTTSGAGYTFQVTDTIANQGGGDAAATVTQYYLSSGTSRNGNAMLLAGSRSVAPLPAGSSSAGTATVTVPANVTAGSYYVLACADDTNLVAETNEANNCAATSAKVQVGPDLIEGGVAASRNPSGAGFSLQVNDTVTNQGGGDAAATVTQYYLSSGTSKNSNAVLLTGNRSIAALPAGSSSTGATIVTLPANVVMGSYYVLACADDTNLVGESNESNNCAATGTRVQVGADLMESAVSTSATLTGTGRTLQVSDTVTNQGSSDAAATVTQYYLSSGTSKSGSAVLLTGSRAVAPLPAGGSSTATTAVTVPANVAVGSYYLLACADDTNLVAESSESNNCTAATSRVQVGPDLIETALSASAAVAGAGHTLQVTDTVTNQGGGDAAATVTQFYLSSGTSKNSGSVLLMGNRAIAALPSGTSSTGIMTVTVPGNVAVGSYYLLGCADDTNLVAETNESNNCIPSALKIKVGPDLIESALSASSSIAGAGSTLQITDTISNQGGGDAAATVTQFYLSTGTSKNTSAVPLTGNRTIAPLPAGASSVGTTAVTVPPNMAVGSYYLIACADDTNLVLETNETNNCTTASTRVQVGPDLIESGVSANATSTGAGSTLQVSDTVTNRGGGDAAAAVSQYYLSSGTSRNGNAVLLTGGRVIDPLPAGASSPGTTTVTVPANMAAGSYYLLACADDTNLVPETNEANNCAAAPTRIQVLGQ